LYGKIFDVDIFKDVSLTMRILKNMSENTLYEKLSSKL
jgi:hypothetical protein